MVYSNCCCSCQFEFEIIKIGQSSHKIYSNNILNFQESMTILNACTKKSGNLLNTPRKFFLFSQGSLRCIILELGFLPYPKLRLHLVMNERQLTYLPLSENSPRADFFGGLFLSGQFSSALFPSLKSSLFFFMLYTWVFFLISGAVYFS